MFGVEYSQVQTIDGGDVVDVTDIIPGEEFESEETALAYIKNWLEWKINFLTRMNVMVALKEHNIIEWTVTGVGITITEQLAVVELGD